MDFANLDALIASLRAAGTIGPTTPLRPTLVAQPGGVRADVVDQLRATQAEHQMDSDWASRAVAWLAANEP